MNLILTGGNSMFILIAYVVIFGGIMYFLAIRPQRKEQKRMQAMLMDMAVKIKFIFIPPSIPNGFQPVRIFAINTTIHNSTDNIKGFFC